MSTLPIIEIKDIGKRYSISHQRGGYVALRDVLTNVLQRPFQFAKQKVKRVTGVTSNEDFWALSGISFDVQQGEVIGIIGKNGSGKSTLLKILTGITPPTKGEITLRGRVASLLEVGTGFHPELTGRENIFLNGAILGMTQKEIVRKFDDIVAFAGIDRFLDTPVKRYSSGMYVRLAFSVAAHMEPDILLVDEVLAVGDAEFQKKCIGKMEEVTEKSGRTILFVSHNLGAIERLCKKTVWLDQGAVRRFGPTKEVIGEYLGKQGQATFAVSEFPMSPTKEAQICKVVIRDSDQQPNANLDATKAFTVDVTYRLASAQPSSVLSLILYTSDGQMILHSSPFDTDGSHKGFKEPGVYTSHIHVPPQLLSAGDYYLEAILHTPLVQTLDHVRNIAFSLHDESSPRQAVYGQTYLGVIGVPLRHEIAREEAALG